MSDDEITNDAQLLAGLLGDRIGAEFGRRYMQFEFVRQYLSLEFDLASALSFRGISWEQVFPDDVEESGLYIKLAVKKVPRNNRFHVVDSGATSTWNSYGIVDNGDTRTVLVEGLPKFKTVDLRPDTAIINRQQKAERRWRERPHPERSGFFRIFEPIRDAQWPHVDQLQNIQWTFLGDDRRVGIESQREFVQKALASPDFAALDGPPGSGKTTVICELVAQVVRNGGRVLLCGQTHEAVDNVLERLMENSSEIRDEIMPIRLGRDISQMSPAAQAYSIQLVGRTIREKIKRDIQGDQERTIAQDRVVAALDGHTNEIDTMLINSANVLCGTTMGVVGSKQLFEFFENAEPIFDVLIVDEASKLTLSEFLVPALLAKKWILSGDPLQLPPFSDQLAIENLLRAKLGLKPIEETEIEEKHGTDLVVAGIALEVIKRFQLRFVRNDPQFARITQRLNDQISLLRNDKDERAVLDFIKQIENLLLRSILEDLISPRPISEGIHSERFTAAIDVGIPEPFRSQRSTLLDVQHRMHPEISALVRNSVYDGRAMKDPPDMSDQRDWMYSRYPNRAVLLGIRTGAVAKGKNSQEEVQRAEAQATANEVIAFIKWADLPENRSIERSVAMISFYRDGVRALNQEMKKIFGSHFEYGSGTGGIDGQIKVRVGTVDKFQGREADLVILNVGNNYLTAHLKSINRINVALTRARYQLVIVGEVSALMRGQEGILLADLARTLPRFEVLRG